MLLIGANRGRKLREGWMWCFHQHSRELASKAPLQPGTRVGAPRLGTPSGLGAPPAKPWGPGACWGSPSSSTGAVGKGRSGES